MPAADRTSRWDVGFRLLYRVLGLLDPVLRAWHGAFGLGNLVELRHIGRRTGLSRSTLLGLLQADGGWYLGHPNGAVAWTRNVDASGSAQLVLRGGPALDVRFVRLDPGLERERAIRATWTQHPFPGDLIYRLARDHVLRRGVYYRLEPTTPVTAA